MNRKFLAFLFLFSFVVATVGTVLNRSYIRTANPSNALRNGFCLVYDATVWSFDNKYYLPQSDNLLSGKGYTIDPANPYMSVRRTPGYSFFFAAHQWAFGVETAHRVIVYTQIVLFSFAVVLFAMTVFNLTGKQSIGSIAGFLYSISFYHIQWLGYNITEAIHPQFLVFSLFFLSMGLRYESSWYFFLGGAFLAVTTLIRPLDGLALPFFLLVAFTLKWRKDFQKKVKRAFLILIGFTIVLAPWVARNYRVTNGEWVFLEKYYDGDPMNMGKGHIAFRSWWSAWGLPKSEQLFAEMTGHCSNDSLSNNWIEKFVADMPPEAFAGYGKVEVKNALGSLMNCHREKLETNIGFKEPHPDRLALKCDEDTKAMFEDLTKAYKQSAPLQYWLLTPLLLAKEYVVQSNSTAWAMLNPPDRNFNFWQWGLKAYMLVLNIALYISLVATVFFLVKQSDIKIMVFGFPIITFFLLVFFARHAEVRYMLQTYVFMFLALAWNIDYLTSKIVSTKTS